MRNKLDQRGNFDVLIIPLVVCGLLVIGLSVFAIWAYGQYTNQRDNTDQIVAAAVAEANEAQKVELEADFAQREKSPVETWRSSAAIGSISVTYPKTWSVYTVEREGKSNPLEAWFHPGAVSGDDDTVRHALRVVVDETAYTKLVDQYEDEIESGTATARPYTRNGVNGIRIDGQIDRNYTGSKVIFTLRDKTVQIWTEADAFLGDLNDIVLKNLKFNL